MKDYEERRNEGLLVEIYDELREQRTILKRLEEDLKPHTYFQPHGIAIKPFSEKH